MSNGVFGSIRPAILDINRDVEILYYYRPTRGSVDPSFTGFNTIDATQMLSYTSTANGDTIDGMYNLKLPANIFNKKGFYTIYIRPKVLTATMVDAPAYLSTYSDVRGAVFNLNDGDLNGLSDLTGYRVEFTGGTRAARIIKSCNRCEPVIGEAVGRSGKVKRYNLTDTSSLSWVFCTLTPSAASIFRPNDAPYIGSPNETVHIINTKFSPKVIEVELVDHDADTISYMLEGDSVRDRDNSIITVYNDNKEIYHQYDYYTQKTTLGEPLYDVKVRRTELDPNENYENIID